MASNWNLFIDGMARATLSPNEVRVLSVVVRRTLGFSKQSDRIAQSVFVESTGLDRRSIRRSLDSLAKRQIVFRSGGGRGNGNIASYTLNLDTTSWKESAVTVESNGAAARHLEKGPKWRGSAPSNGAAARHTIERTRSRTPATPSGRPSEDFTNEDIFEVFEAAGGTFYSDDGRKKFGAHIKTALKRGVGRDVVFAAAREVGRKNGFGLLSQIEAIQAHGMPCIHAGLEHMALTVEQLRECPCATCAEWVAHRQRAKLTVLEGGKAGVA